MTIGKLKKMQVGQTVIYPNTPFSSSLLNSVISTDGREYIIVPQYGMCHLNLKITRTC